MLGYNEEDLNKMIASINFVYELVDSPINIKEDLMMASDFLQGLWAEGYFD